MYVHEEYTLTHSIAKPQQWNEHVTQQKPSYETVNTASVFLDMNDTVLPVLALAKYHFSEQRNGCSLILTTNRQPFFLNVD